MCSALTPDSGSGRQGRGTGQQFHLLTAGDPTTRADVMALNCVLFEQFIAAQAKVPNQLVLDVDAWDVPRNGGRSCHNSRATTTIAATCR